MSEEKKSVMIWPYLVGGPILGYVISYFFQPPEFKAKVTFGKYLFYLKDTLFGGGEVSAIAWICIVIGFIIGIIIAFVVKSKNSASS